MPFDLVNDSTGEEEGTKSKRPPAASSSPTLMTPTRAFLDELQSQGKVPEGLENSVQRRMKALAHTRDDMDQANRTLIEGSRLLARRNIQERQAAAGERRSPGEGAFSPSTPPAMRASSWRFGSLERPKFPPRRVILQITGVGRNPTQSPNYWVVERGRFAPGSLVVGELEASATVAQLRDVVWRYLLPGPHSEIVIEHRGMRLDPEDTLLGASLAEDARLGVRVQDKRAAEPRGLSRVRVGCTALATRSVALPLGEKERRALTGAELKALVCGALAGGEYEWWDPDGKPIRFAKGATAVALEAAEAVEGGTGAVRKGEELILDAPEAAKLKGGKGSGLARRRLGGDAVEVSEAMVAFIAPPPDKMRLSYAGAEIGEAQVVWELGVRTDDLVTLEFESPATPEILQLLRSPDPPKKEKGGKGGKK